MLETKLIEEGLILQEFTMRRMFMHPFYDVIVRLKLCQDTYVNDSYFHQSDYYDDY